MTREFSQAELCGAMFKALDKLGLKSLNARQMNAVIHAADDIIQAIDRSHIKAVPASGIHAWLASDDAGLSSKYLARVLCKAAQNGVTIHVASGWDSERVQIPYDPADFGRCVGMLDAAPELRAHLSVMLAEEHGPVWHALVKEWEKFEAWYRDDLPTGKSDRLYEAITAIHEAAQKEVAA